MFAEAQGLQNLIVTALCQDREGYLWVGTENGLFRYDGRRFLGFNTRSGLPNNGITALYAGPDGTLLVGTRKGLAWRTGNRFRTSADPSLRTVIFAHGMAASSSGRLLLVTPKGLAYAALKPDASDLRLDYLPLSLPPGRSRITSVLSEAGGAAWFGCGTALCRAEGGAVRVWGAAEGVPEDGWQSLARDSAGVLWARSRIYLIRMPAGAESFTTVARANVAPLHFAFPAVLADTEGVFVPTDNGLSMLRNGVWSRVGHRQGLPGSIATAVLRDRQGSLWVGTTAGLARWEGGLEWQNFTEFEGLAPGDSRALLEDAPGSIWAGMAGGLSHGTVRDGVWNWITVNDPGIAWVTNLWRARDGGIWFCGTDARVARLDPKTGKVRWYGQFSEPPYNIYVDSRGTLWVILTHAIFRAAATDPPGTFEQVHPTGATPTTVFGYAREDVHGDLWFSSFGGLYRLSGGKWSVWRKSDGLTGTSPWRLLAAPAGELYVTYFDDSAIDRILVDGDRLRLEPVDRSHGLEDDHVYFVDLDRQGRMWALTDHGAHLRDGGRWIAFDQSDGLLRNDCNTFLAASDGGIWIGSERGLTRMPSPRSGLRTDPLKPVVSELWIDSHLVDPSLPVVTASSTGFLAKFTTLDLVHGPRDRFRYRCTGLDDNGRELPQPEVNVDELRPGRYRLEVQVSRDASPWSAATAVVLDVAPRWFETLWFRLLVLLSVVCAICIAWRMRVRYYAAAQAKLQEAVESGTRELRAANDRLVGEIAERDIANREKHRLQEQLAEARKLESLAILSGGMAHEFNNLLTIVNGYAGLLRIRFGNNQLASRELAEIEKAANKAAGLTQQLLSYARRRFLQTRTVLLNSVLEQGCERWKKLLAPNIRLQTELEAKSAVAADPEQIVEAVTHLLRNANQAMPDGGVVTLRTRDVEFSTASTAHGPGRFVMLQVADSGIGMDEATRQRMFEPFFTTHERARAAGLGLATVQGIVAQHEGSISVETAPGKGCTITIYLPAAPAPR